MAELWQAARAQQKRITPLTRKPLAPVGDQSNRGWAGDKPCRCGYHVCSGTGPCADPEYIKHAPEKPANRFNFPVTVAHEHGQGVPAPHFFEEECAWLTQEIFDGARATMVAQKRLPASDASTVQDFRDSWMALNETERRYARAGLEQAYVSNLRAQAQSRVADADWRASRAAWLEQHGR